MPDVAYLCLTDNKFIPLLGFVQLVLGLLKLRFVLHAGPVAAPEHALPKSRENITFWIYRM